MKGFDFWQFLAGIAVFVYAMSLIESSLKSLAGRPFKKFLQKQSKSTLKMIAASTVVTTVLQSSSVVLLMILSFVGAGLINMRGALAAMLGSNLGTTFSNWIIALIGFKINFEAISYPVFAFSLVGLFLFKKNSKFYHATTFFIGFAFVFIALEWLKSSAGTSLDGALGRIENWHYLAFVPIGILITAVIQSSSATVAITLAALYHQLIPFESAAAIVIGAEVGTTLKFLIASAGGIPDKKRFALGDFFLNLMTMVLAAILLKPLVYLIQHVIGVSDHLVALVVFQTGINLLSIILFYPILGSLAKFLDRFFKEMQPEQLTTYIRKGIVERPGDRLVLAVKETTKLMDETIELNKAVLGVGGEKETGLMGSIKEYASGSTSFDETYNKMKTLQGEILEYIAEISADEMNEQQMEQTGKLMNVVRHILRSTKNLKDIKHNLEDYSGSADDNLFKIISKVQENAKTFYLEFQDLIADPENVNAEKIKSLISRNRKQYDDAIASILQTLSDKKVGELDSSTLLNVYREIYSSNKALIRALADLKDLSGED